MSYTGQEIFNMSMAIGDALSDTGQINDSEVKEYKFRAPYFLDMFQQEWKDVENISEITKITSLNQILQVSEKGATAGAYYLSRFFAISDQNMELADVCQSKYETLKRECKKPLPATEIVDVYNLYPTD